MRYSLILLAAFLAVPANAQDPPSRSRPVATAEAFELVPPLSSAGFWTREIRRDGAAFLKPRFASVDLRAGDELRVIDGRGRTVERITGRGPGGRGGFWGLSVPGDRLALELRTRRAYDRPPFRVERLMVGDAEALAARLPSPFAKSICSPAEFSDAICHQGDAGRWANVLATAGILEIVGDQAFFCTGVSVTPRHMVLTTESCLSDTAACEDAEFIFGQYRDGCGSGDVSTDWQSYRCLETVASSPFGNQCEPDTSHLDFSLHRLDGEPAAEWGYADPDPTPLTSGEGLYIVQHADGRPLELTEGDGADVVVDGFTLRYFGSLDTESSSVGAPVFRDADDRLVALHHCGGCATPGVGNRGVMMRDVEPLIEPFLCDDSVMVEPAAGSLTPVEGNGDAVLDPGETWQLTPRLRNVACAADASGVSASFQVGAGSASVQLLDAASTVGAVAASSAGNGTAVRFTLDAQAPCDGEVILDLDSIQSDQGSFAGETGHASLDVGEVPTDALLVESFDAGIPVGWTVDHQGTGVGEGSTWTADDPGGRELFPSPYAIADSEFLGPGETMDERLVSPAVDTTAYTSVTLRFDHRFRWYDGEMNEKADVDVRSAATSGAWTNVLRYQGADAAGIVEVDLTPFSAADLQIRFRYYDAEWEWWWAVDHVEILGDNGRACFTSLFVDGFETGTTNAWSLAVP